MNRIGKNSLKTLAFAAVSAFILTGCLMGKDDKEDAYVNDGQGAFMASEMDQMGLAASEIPVATNEISAAAAKTASAYDTISGELLISRTFDTTCQCFIRHATYNGSEGFERDRLDSITLIDTAGVKMDQFDFSVLASIVHKRHVTRSGPNHVIDVEFNTVMVVMDDGGVKKGVWNGTMTGSFDGETIQTATVTNVTRAFSGGRFQYAESGTVVLTRPVFRFTLEFLGDAKSRLTIERWRTGKTVAVVYIDRNYQESAGAE